MHRLRRVSGKFGFVPVPKCRKPIYAEDSKDQFSFLENLNSHSVRFTYFGAAVHIGRK
jgi:hypothetical protein